LRWMYEHALDLGGLVRVTSRTGQMQRSSIDHHFE
jgi:hypothetical protein